jgi:hypothetical protein
MAIKNFDLNLDQFADSTSYSWTLYAADGVTPINLTGATARSMIRTLPADLTPLVSITTTLNSQGLITLGGAAGTVALDVTKAATGLLVAQSVGARASQYLWDMFVDFPNGTSTRILAGNVNVGIAITH